MNVLLWREPRRAGPRARNRSRNRWDLRWTRRRSRRRTRRAGSVVDVREGHEYVAGHVPGALLMPLDEVPARMHELPKDRPVYVICATGNRSLLAAAAMSRAGIDARSVAGGTTARRRVGGRVVRGRRAA